MKTIQDVNDLIQKCKKENKLKERIMICASKEEKLENMFCIAKYAYIYVLDKKELRKKRYKCRKRVTNYKDKHRDCEICGVYTSAVHHILPLSAGGGSTKYNLIALCRDCHDIVHPWMKNKRMEYGKIQQVL